MPGKCWHLSVLISSLCPDLTGSTLRNPPKHQEGTKIAAASLVKLNGRCRLHTEAKKELFLLPILMSCLPAEQQDSHRQLLLQKH